MKSQKKICSKCFLIKPLTDFPIITGPKRKNGIRKRTFSCTCIFCKNENQRRNYCKNYITTVKPIILKKECKKCNIVKPIHLFGEKSRPTKKNPNNKMMRGNCKECEAKETRTYILKIKNDPEKYKLWKEINKMRRSLFYREHSVNINKKRREIRKIPENKIRAYELKALPKQRVWSKSYQRRARENLLKPYLLTQLHLRTKIPYQDLKVLGKDNPEILEMMKLQIQGRRKINQLENGK